MAIATFAFSELAIGLYGLTSPTLILNWLPATVAPLGGGLAGHITLAMLSLLLPTLLMGATLPILSPAVVDGLDRASQRISSLYLVNMAGAGCGALATGFYLIGAIGFDGAIKLAATCNFVVAAIGLTLGLVSKPQRAAAAPPPIGMATGSGSDHRLVAWVLFSFISGFVIICLQIVWYRLVSVLTGGVTYSFPTVLGMILIGDSLGLYVGQRIVHRFADQRRIFLGAQLALSIIAALAIAALPNLLHVGSMEFESGAISKTAAADRSAFMVMLVATAAGLTLIPSVLSGFAYPFAQAAIQNDNEPPRVCRRLQLLRGWSHDEQNDEQVFT